MSKVEIIERRIQTYRIELRKLKLQLKIAKLEQPASEDKNRADKQAADERR
jgi:hypothetical protein